MSKQVHEDGRGGWWVLGVGIWLVGGALMLSACDSDFVADPTRPHRGRAVESPMGVGSPNSEVLGNTTGAVPLVSVDMPNKRDEQPVVHTIMDPLNSKPLAASRPATQAATQPEAPDMTVPPPPVGSIEIKVVAQQKPGDSVRITRDNEANADVWILCSSGIGTVTLERAGESWPALLRVHLRYDADKPFSNLEGFTANELTASGAKVPLKAAIDKVGGKAEITVPGFARGKQVLIEWVDAYR